MTSPSVGILVIGHGSPRADANAKFVALVERMARRLSSARVLAAFFSIARPNIQDQSARLAAEGVRRILLMPYFLFTGQHVTVDIPALMDECRQQLPGLEFELLPTLEDDPVLEDLVVERLVPRLAPDRALPREGAEIERESYAWIDGQLADWPVADPVARQVIRRVVHATADLSFARTLRFHPQAGERGLAAFAQRRSIVCDVRMLQAGLTKVPGEVLCAIDRPDVADEARRAGTTRAAAAMELAASQWADGIVAVGNAPTALWKVMEVARRGGPRPALVVGLPVGFVGARESKQALLESGLCYITNVGSRGGSPVAAAALNALATYGTSNGTRTA